MELESYISTLAQTFRVKSCQERHTALCRMGKIDDGEGDFTVVAQKEAECLPKILKIGACEAPFEDEFFYDKSLKTSVAQTQNVTQNLHFILK